MGSGVWRSWLAYLHGVQGVVSSSLTTPTKKERDHGLPWSLFAFYSNQILKVMGPTGRGFTILRHEILLILPVIHQQQLFLLLSNHRKVMTVRLFLVFFFLMESIV